MLRNERDLTQAEAAELAKLDEKHWQDVERARTNPTVATLVGIARALGVSLKALFESSAKQPAPRNRGSGPAPRNRGSGPAPRKRGSRTAPKPGTP